MTFRKTRPTLEVARQKAEKYCAYQERSHAEVKRKLLSLGLSLDEANDVLLHLIQHNFLNEDRFATAYSRGKFKIKQWGRQKIVYQLKGKGINEKLIHSAMLNIDADEYLNTLKTVILKKWNLLKDENIDIKSQKVFKYMLQKGYESELILIELKELKKLK